MSGTAINFLALGVTGYFFIQIYGENGTPGNVPRIPDIDRNSTLVGDAIRHIRGIPRAGHFLDDVFGHLNLMIWLSFLLLIVAHITLFKTPIGLRIRSVGEHPRAADTVGISVYGTRYSAVVLSGMLAALGGAYLSIGYLGSFGENMTAGRGFIALAAVIFGNWRPFGAFAAALLFGGSTALSFRRRALPGPALRPHLDRRGWCDRPLDTARRGWSPLRQAVTRRRLDGAAERRCELGPRRPL